VHRLRRNTARVIRSLARAGQRAESVEALVLGAVVAAALVVYCWDLDIEGWGNAYYAAVAQTGSASWTSMFFGSLEPGNAVASDKPPLAFWPMALSVRAFGLSGWAVILPQALETAATIVVLHRTVRMLSGRLGALVAAVVFGTTPIVVALARFDDPDTLLTLLVVAAAYCCIRGVRAAGRDTGGRRGADTWWLVGAGVLLGLAFLTKWSGAFVPLPGFLAALVIGPAAGLRSRWRRVALVAGPAAVTGLSWVAVVASLPPRLRPYADSSSGSILTLVLGQDGLSRLGSSAGPGASQVSGLAGAFRLFSLPFSGQVGWLLPLALVFLAMAPLALRRRLSPGRLLFSGWLCSTVLVFSFMAGPMHPYYSDLLAPAAAAVIGFGVADQVRRPGRVSAVWMIVPVMTLAFEAWVAMAYGLPLALVWVSALLGVAALGGAALMAGHPVGTSSRVRLLPAAAMVAALVTSPAAFAVDTLRHPVTGANPLAGPMTTRPAPLYSQGITTFLRIHREGRLWVAAVPRGTAASLLQLQSREPVLPLGGFTGHSGGPTLAQVKGWLDRDMIRYVLVPRGYVSFPSDVPPQFVGYPIARILAWAAQVGCPQQVSDARYVVLDLEEGACPGGAGVAASSR
jgi:4-amino-4-deoxy-L-arabinose transferase-like glycosyltransferase